MMFHQRNLPLENGIYQVTFQSHLNSGSGVIVLNDGLINGGDAGFTFQGNLETTEEKLKATIHVSQYDPFAISTFGQVSDFSLQLEGHALPQGFNIRGNIVGSPDHQIKITGKYLKPLV